MMSLLTWISTTAYSTWLQEDPGIWGFPLALAVHTLGMGILVGASWAVALRLLGFASGIPTVHLRPLFGVMWFGFWINAVSGVVMFIAHPVERGTSPVFWFKIAMVVLGMLAVSRLRHLLDATGEGSQVPPQAKPLAWASLSLWVAAVTAGRLIAYIGGNG